MDDQTRRDAAESPALLLHTPAKRGFTSVTCELPLDLSLIGDEQKKDPEYQEIMVKAKSQQTKDLMRTHYVFKNEVLFRSVPDSKEGQRFQFVVKIEGSNFDLHMTAL